MGSATVIRADARQLPLPSGCVDLVVTSPPYYALRSYTDGGQHYHGQIGSEPTPAEYIAGLIECTREMMRVLKPSGSIWVDLGDKYSQYEGIRKGHGRSIGRVERAGRGEPLSMPVSAPTQWGIAPKSLMLLPERYRIACVDQLGLIARAVVIWSKPNGLPESVTDRVRRSHEDWVHLTKQPQYYSAVDEIRIPHVVNPADARKRQGSNPLSGQKTLRPVGPNSGAYNALGALPGSVWTIPTEPLTVPDHLGVDHFAAFPTEWPRRLILGWSPSDICTVCGEGRRPVAERTPMQWRESPTIAGRSTGGSRRPASGTMLAAASTTILGYTCACPEPTAPSRPAVVLDPMGGTGTTALVAKALGRHGITVDRSADYCRLARWRTTNPGELAKAMRVDKPAPIPEAQLALDLGYGEGVRRDTRAGFGGLAPRADGLAGRAVEAVADG